MMSSFHFGKIVHKAIDQLLFSSGGKTGCAHTCGETGGSGSCSGSGGATGCLHCARALQFEIVDDGRGAGYAGLQLPPQQPRDSGHHEHLDRGKPGKTPH